LLSAIGAVWLGALALRENASIMSVDHKEVTCNGLTPVAGLIFETKNRAIFLERFFWRDFSGAALLPVQLCSH